MARKPKVSKENHIPNWTAFGVQSFNIEIHFYDYDEEDEPIYGSAFGFFLDNGPDNDEDDPQYITIYTDLTGPDPMTLAWMMLHSFDHNLFGGRLCDIWLFDDEGEPVQMDIQEIMNITEETHEDNQVMVH